MNYSGKTGVLLFGATTIQLKSWEATEECDWEDASDSASSPNKSYVPGFQVLNISATGLFKGLALPAAATQGTFTLSSAGGLSISGTMNVKSRKYNNETPITVTLEGMSDGAYTIAP